MNNQYPTLSWIRTQLRNNLTNPFRKKVLYAYVVGSEARGTSSPKSDLDIAVVIEPLKRKTALKLTEEYHQKFVSESLKPKWNNRTVDFQFFYQHSRELAGYKKIELL
ncbi:nucleotidyltransferase domain-containing protein [Priestia filamentosa]|uniref:nucleotidyltransferase domain-containing protein n=1 Tax=Priestia filamentosa TaxID=1402861 RepID=UPI00397AF826